jgi:OOP family OmpA-OmpF porin
MTPKHQLSAISLCGLSLLASNCFAQEQPYYYGGVSVGQSQTNLEADHITQTQIGNGFTIDSIKRDEKDTAYKLFGGYQFNRFYALEGGFFYLGKPHFTANTTPTGTLNGQTKMQGWNLDVVGTLPMTDRLSALARVGLLYTTTTATFTGTGAVVPAEANPRRTQTSYKGGVGLQYEISPSFLVRAEFERYRVSDAPSSLNPTQRSLSTARRTAWMACSSNGDEAGAVHVPQPPPGHRIGHKSRLQKNTCCAVPCKAAIE